MYDVVLDKIKWRLGETILAGSELLEKQEVNLHCGGTLGIEKLLHKAGKLLHLQCAISQH
jgi:hypothetical protein